MDKNVRTYTGKERNMYLAGLIGQNMLYNIIGTGLLFYLQSVIFLPAMAISVIFAVARVWDAINDPMMGTFVDKTRTKYGKARPYLMVAPAICAIITILCFINGTYSSENSATTNVLIIGWAAISYILWGMIYTVGDIPLWSMPSLMTESSKDRATILSLARIVAAFGSAIVLVSIVPVSQKVGVALEGVVGVENSQKYGFIIVAVILTIVATVLFQCASYAKERVEKTEKQPSFKDNVKTMVNNKPFFRILLSGILRSPIFLLNTIAFTVLSYYYGNYYGDYMIYLVILGGGLYVGQFVAMVLVPLLQKKIEKKTLYNVLTVAGAFPYLGIYVMYKIMPYDLDAPVALAICCVIYLLSGVAMGGLSVLQSVMIADAVDYEEYHNNNRPDGIFFSGQSFITKLSSGVASLISGIVYAAVGFSGDNVKKINDALYAGADFKTAYPEVAEAMFFIVSVPAFVGMLVSVIPMLKYELDNKTHGEILKSLIERRAESKVDTDTNE